jgi:dCMP deaminase
MPHCDDVGHMLRDVIDENGKVSKHCVRTIHSEQNAICQAARFGVSLDDATLYCTMEPCFACAKMIVNVGIKRVVVRKKYHAGGDTRDFFKEAGIMFDVLENKTEEYKDQ